MFVTKLKATVWGIGAAGAVISGAMALGQSGTESAPGPLAVSAKAAPKARPGGMESAGDMPKSVGAKPAPGDSIDRVEMANERPEIAQESPIDEVPPPPRRALSRSFRPNKPSPETRTAALEQKLDRILIVLDRMGGLAIDPDRAFRGPAGAAKSLAAQPPSDDLNPPMVAGVLMRGADHRPPALPMASVYPVPAPMTPAGQQVGGDLAPAPAPHAPLPELAPHAPLPEPAPHSLSATQPQHASTPRPANGAVISTMSHRLSALEARLEMAVERMAKLESRMYALERVVGVVSTNEPEYPVRKMNESQSTVTKPVDPRPVNQIIDTSDLDPIPAARTTQPQLELVRD